MYGSKLRNTYAFVHEIFIQNTSYIGAFVSFYNLLICRPMYNIWTKEDIYFCSFEK